MTESLSPKGFAHEERVQELALAGLLHDVGKVLQRAATPEESQRLARDRDVFCPTDPVSGRKTHHHSAYTADFLDRHLSRFVTQGQGDDNIIGWASRHHNPGSPWDWIVAEADRIASGMDRGHTDETWGGWQDVIGRRLVPLLARVRSTPTGPQRDPGKPRFPLGPLSLDRHLLFPVAEDVKDAGAARKQYADLAKGFRDDFVTYVGSPERTLDSMDRGEALSQAIQSALAVMTRYFWAVPAATNIPVSDVSLFDHSRTTGALAAALTAAMLDSGRRDGDTAWICDRKDPRYAVVYGDLSGIQKYISAVASGKAAQTLRGRSFSVQLLTDAIGWSLARHLGLPACSIISATAGHLLLLAPATRAEGLASWAEEVDLYLSEETEGRLAFSLGSAPATGADLIHKAVSDIRDKAIQDCHHNRTHRLRGLVKRDYHRVFDVTEVRPELETCKACGADNAIYRPTPGDARCDRCEEARVIGARLPHARFVLRHPGPTPPARGPQPATLTLGGPLAVSYVLATEEEDLPYVESGTLFRLGIDLPDVPPMRGVAVGLWPVARNVPFRAEVPLSYEDLARTCSGVPTLGVLRADVDNLGAVFRHGFLEENASLSRLASLSFHLTLFFAGYVGRLVATGDVLKQSVQIIFSGGDDLFLVGGWDRLPGLAYQIRSELRAFAANDNLSLSAGVVSDGPNAPVIALSERAGNQEHHAKSFLHRPRSGSSSESRRKDAVAVLGRVLAWEELAVAAAMARDLELLISEEVAAGFEGFLPAIGTTPAPNQDVPKLPRGILQRLLAIARLEHESRLGNHSMVDINTVTAKAQQGKWAWHLAYSLTRTAERHRPAGGTLQAIRDATASASYRGIIGERDVIEYLEVPAYWALMRTRTRKENDDEQ